MSPDQEQAIRDDEKIRFQSRAELEKAERARKTFSLWEFVNSGIALWFLSSVVLTTIVSCSTYHTEAAVASRRADDCDKEIKTRLASFRAEHELKTIDFDAFFKNNDARFKGWVAPQDGSDPSLPWTGWYGGLFDRWANAQSSQFGHPELKYTPIKFLFITYRESLSKAGRLNSKREMELVNAERVCNEISKICFDEYAKLNEDGLTVDGYHSAMKGVFTQVSKRLDSSDLKEWAQ